MRSVFDLHFVQRTLLHACPRRNHHSLRASVRFCPVTSPVKKHSSDWLAALWQ